MAGERASRLLGIGRRSPWLLGLAGMLAVAVAVAVAGPATVAGAAVGSTGSSPVELFVTSPPDPVTAAPGTTATSTLTVGNLGHANLDVSIETRSVTLMDNGKTRFGAGPDPRFAGRITIIPDALSLAPRHERTVQVAVRMPPGLPPDDYFLGFLVSPVVNSSSVTVRNDVGGLVVLGVPGPRDRRLTAQFEGPSWLNLSLSGAANGSVRVTSVGTSTVAFTTTVLTSGWPAPDPRYEEVNSQLLPAGLSRDVPVAVSSWLGIGWYTFHASFVYDKVDQATGEVSVSRTVFVLNPLWLLVIPVISLLIMWRRTRRRRLRGRKKGLHSAGRPTSAPRNLDEPVPVG